jgi:N-acetylglutamate synthase
VVAVRALTTTPVRTAQIRALEHAAALAQPGVEHRWLDGWFLRAGMGVVLAANSAVPIEFSATPRAIPAIVDWYAQRRLPPRLALPDRLLQISGPAEQSHRLLVRDVNAVKYEPLVELSSHPTAAWLRSHGSSALEEDITAGVDADLVFGTHPSGATARAAVTDAPDDTRWVGVSALRLTDTDQSQVAARQLTETLLAWGGDRGASRAYLRVCDSDVAVGQVAESFGFVLHHRGRYVVAGRS